MSGVIHLGDTNIRLILTYACLQFDLSLSHQIKLTVLQCFMIHKATRLSRTPTITSQQLGREAAVYVRVYDSR